MCIPPPRPPVRSAVHLPIVYGEEDGLRGPIPEGGGELGRLPAGEGQAVVDIAESIIGIPRSAGLLRRVAGGLEDLRHGAVLHAGDVAPVGRRAQAVVGAV